MDHIQQLKKIRTDAIARMRNTPDFKLAGKLGILIVELGETVDDEMDYEEAEEQPAIPANISARRPVTTAIAPMETPVETLRPFESIFEKQKKDELADKDEFADLASDKMIDELVAEIEGDVAGLGAVLEEDETEALDEPIGPFLKPDHAKQQTANGAAH